MHRIYFYVIIALTQSVFNACMPYYSHAKESMTTTPIQLERNSGVSQSVGGVVEVDKGTNSKEKIYASQLNYQINKSFKYASYGWGVDGYIGQYLVFLENDSSLLYQKYDSSKQRIYGFSPDLRLSVFYPFRNQRIGAYVLQRKIFEYGSYNKFIEEGSKLHEITDLRISDKMTITTVFYEGWVNERNRIGIEMGFNPTTLISYTMTYQHDMNSVWLAIAPGP